MGRYVETFAEALPDAARVAEVRQQLEEAGGHVAQDAARRGDGPGSQKPLQHQGALPVEGGLASLAKGVVRQRTTVKIDDVGKGRQFRHGWAVVASGP